MKNCPYCSRSLRTKRLRKKHWTYNLGHYGSRCTVRKFKQLYSYEAIAGMDLDFAPLPRIAR